MPNLKNFKVSLKSLGKDIFVLSAGILVAQIIPLALQPFLKRTFTPEEFGTYDVFLKTFSILVALSCLKYENAILLPKKDSDSKHVVFLCLVISSLVFVVITILIILFKDYIFSRFEGLTLATLLLLPISVLSYTVFNIFNMYLIRRRKFMLSSTSKVSRRISEGFVQLILGLGSVPNGLLFGDVVGNVVQAVFTFWKVRVLSPLKFISWNKIKKVFFEYRELPIYTLTPNILNTFVLGSLTFLVLSKFDKAEVGYLEFTQKILSIPSVFISIAISQVVFQRVSQLINKREKILPLIIPVVFFLTLVSIVFILTIEFYGIEIFTLVGGEDWQNSGEYAQILVYSSATMLIFSPLGKILIALKKFKTNSLWEILKFIAIVSLFFIDEVTSIKEYLKIYTLIIVFFYILYGGIILINSYKYQIEEVKDI
ncbi:lipopolysaccharide biosynthesis protein [Flagellimonas marinaquae]|uniref:lipopolysaccharide biosynthesis protein n=1 Tax=Flagellimonas aurea TaxID=2915619 RepID=UPI001CE22953|nr:lipopolysaccharide biosynthesis protein [Allomuricauda aquimarina]